MDIADRAQPREAEFQAAALAAVLNQPREMPRIVGGVRVCLDCDDPLGRQRLKANPHAVRCLDCQEQHEHEQKRARGGSIL